MSGYEKCQLCIRRKMYSSDFCMIHRCVKRGCKNSDNCPKHTICSEYPNCKYASKGNEVSLCRVHACNYLGCKHYKDMCPQHPTCGYTEEGVKCYEIIYPNEKACREHTCAYVENNVRCKNMSLSCKHKCKVSSCKNVIVNENTDYCIRHLCGYGGVCMNEFSECYKHGCDIVTCHSYKHDVYRKCIKHLTYDDIIDGLSLSGFYFGVLPRDIAIMLKAYF